MMLIRWSESADADMAGILAYFASNAEETIGKKIIAQLLRSTRRLESNPLSGRPGRVKGTREIVIRTVPYIIVCELPEKGVAEVIRVIHTSRLWP